LSVLDKIVHFSEDKVENGIVCALVLGQICEIGIAEWVDLNYCVDYNSIEDWAESPSCTAKPPMSVEAATVLFDEEIWNKPNSLNYKLEPKAEVDCMWVLDNTLTTFFYSDDDLRAHFWANIIIPGCKIFLE
jgi:hypothetical protein